MDHGSARLAIDALFQGQGRKRSELRAHLDGCLDCRAHYDRTARAFRALAGRPEEMTPEEQWLFEPALPEEPKAPSRFPALLYGGVATIGVVSLMLVLAQPEESKFAARGGAKAALQPSARAFCARGGQPVGEAAAGLCQPDDRLLFSLTGQGRAYAAVVLVEGERTSVLVSGAEGALAAGQPEVVLGKAAVWRPGLAAVAVFSDSPIAPADAERCARGDCALERAPISLSTSEP